MRRGEPLSVLHLNVTLFSNIYAEQKLKSFQSQWNDTIFRTISLEKREEKRKDLVACLLAAVAVMSTRKPSPETRSQTVHADGYFEVLVTEIAKSIIKNFFKHFPLYLCGNGMHKISITLFFIQLNLSINKKIKFNLDRRQKQL